MQIDTTGFAIYVKVMRIVFLLLNLGIVVLNAYFLYYVYQIEESGCRCALGWRRSFIEVSLGLFVIMGIVGLVVDWEDHFMWLSALYNGLIIAYLFVTREYINDMKSHHCDCAQTKAFGVLNVVNIIGLFLLAVTLLALLGLVLFWGLTRGGGTSSSAPHGPPRAIKKGMRSPRARRMSFR